MIRRPPRSTLDRSSAASDVYKRQRHDDVVIHDPIRTHFDPKITLTNQAFDSLVNTGPVSYTHLRAHETVLDLVCRLLLEKKKKQTTTTKTNK